MSATRNYGIPDIELPLPKGGTVNPSDFAGHELVVLFCHWTASPPHGSWRTIIAMRISFHTMTPG
jgi:peroxiredoxin